MVEVEADRGNKLMDLDLQLHGDVLRESSEVRERREIAKQMLAAARETNLDAEAERMEAILLNLDVEELLALMKHRALRIAGLVPMADNVADRLLVLQRGCPSRVPKTFLTELL